MIRLYIIAAVLAILTGCKANPTIPSDGYGELAVTTVSALALEPVAGLYDVSLVQQHYDGQLTGAQASAIALLRDWQWWPQYGEEPAVTVLAAQLAQYREDLLTPGENYLGLSNDPWLLERLQAGLVHEPNKRVDNTLRQWLDKQVVAKKLTGYNLTLRSDAPGFKSDYSVLYGHSNALHMRQLVALLNQQDVLAKVALVPKHSIFV